MIETFHILAQATMPATQPVSVDSLYAFYAANLRSSFFSGFLTLGSFLVAVNTFIVVNLKKELYDHDGYRARVVQRRLLSQANGKPKVSFFGPLRRLSQMLFWSIMSSLITAVLQLTVGVIPGRCTALICLSAAAITLIVLFSMLLVVRCNLQAWFGFLEDEAVKKHEQNTTDSN